MSTRPILRWAGGKRTLLPLLHAIRPTSINRYFEPFIGGGALFFSLDHPGSQCVINDMNPELVCLYTQLRDNPDDLIRHLGKLADHTSKDAYYAFRAQQPELLSDLGRAVRFVYLNKLCFNGLWRVNSSNEFNVPYANLKNPTVLDEEALRTASKRLQHTTIRQQDFADCLADAAAGDWVYLDPPYIPLSPSSSFSRYAADDFTKPDHQRLADTIQDLINRGVNVTLSNSDTPTTREIYDALGSDWQIHSVQVRRSIGAKADTRTKVGEILACSYPLEDSHDPALAGRILGLGDEPEVEADEADTSPS